MAVAYAVIAIFVLVGIIYGVSVLTSRRETARRVERARKRRLRRGKHEDRP